MSEPFLNITEFHRAVADNLAAGSAHLAKIEVSNLSWIGAQYGETAVATSMRNLHEMLREEFGFATVGRVSTSLLGITAPGSHDADDVIARLNRLRNDINHRATMPFLVDLAVGYTFADQKASAEVSVWIESANVALLESVRRRRLVVYSAQLEDTQFLRVHVARWSTVGERPDRFRWVYQPISDLISGEVVFAEALVRWYLDGFGEVSPDQFIPLAEDLDVIHVLDRWSIRNAIESLAAVEPHRRIPVSVNVSARSFSEQRGIAAYVADELRANGVDESCLILELTESAAIDDISHLSRELSELSRAGVRVAIDDFGKGQTNLFALASLPVSILKLDRSLYALADEERVLEMLGVGVTLGHTIGAKVLAEGIECPNTLALARRAGADYGQGWFLGEPQAELPTRS